MSPQYFCCKKRCHGRDFISLIWLMSQRENALFVFLSGDLSRQKSLKILTLFKMKLNVKVLFIFTSICNMYHFHLCIYSFILVCWCIIFIWDMKQTYVYFRIHISKKFLKHYIFKTFWQKVLNKVWERICYSLTCQIFYVSDFWPLQGSHDSQLSSISKLLEKFTAYWPNYRHFKIFCM